ncbi:MAG TPA: geranylgeranyl reductase family protein, partial [Chryseolinea sp.]|nr:geranylgeranyl reductase family protein [Chryseolinea sp.]
MKKEFDVLIVGAGPAGSATAIALGNSNLSVGLLDKARFPRDKICGDALSLDVVNQLKFLSPSLSEAFKQFDQKVFSFGVQIFSPDNHHIDLPFVYNNEKQCGYVCTRFGFDNMLAAHVKTYPNVQLLEEHHVTRITHAGQHIEIETTQGIFSSKIIVGSDGAHSVVSRKFQNSKPDKDHYSAGLRMYYEGITGFHNESFIELHFFREILPGYLWIFPLPDNKANVGIGMLSSTLSKKKINLKDTLARLIGSHPALMERFRHARPLETVKGYGLPLGSKKRVLSGNRFLLTGDAASLIDPFSGEGIANAIRSGRIAAAHIFKCFESNDFSESFNEQY